jgi:hypothetical protein
MPSQSRKYSAILGNLGNTCDRFLSTAYKEQPGKAEMLRQAASIPGAVIRELTMPIYKTTHI